MITREIQTSGLRKKRISTCVPAHRGRIRVASVRTVHPPRRTVAFVLYYQR